MPLIQSKSKQAFKKNVASEMDSGKPQKQSLAIAFEVQRKAKAKKMSSGGMVSEFQDQERPACIADAIRRKRKDAQCMADGGMVDSQEDPESFDELNEDAAGEDLYDDSQLSAQPEDSNEHGDSIESDAHDMVGKIRSKMKAKREGML